MQKPVMPTCAKRGHGQSPAFSMCCCIVFSRCTGWSLPEEEASRARLRGPSGLQFLGGGLHLLNSLHPAMETESREGHDE